MNGGGQEERRMGRAASAKAQRRGQVAGKGPAVVIQDGWGLEFKGGWQTMRPERQQGPVLGGLRSVIQKTMRPVEVFRQGVR